MPLESHSKFYVAALVKKRLDRQQTKPFIIPVFIPHAGCPHRCVFCNQKAIAGDAAGTISISAVQKQIRQYLTYRKKKHRRVQISFYGGNFLGLPRETIRSLLEEACGFIAPGQAQSIRFSTRPDTISPEKLELLSHYPVRTIEIGVQSMDDRVLAESERGHSAKDTEHAVGMLKDTSYEIGLQMMVGLPSDDRASTWATARKIAAMAPDFVRIYPAVVLENSRLAQWHADGKFTPLTTEEAVQRVKKIYRLFQRLSIAVVRMGLQASEVLDAGSVLAGPYHPAFGHLVLSSIWLDRASALLAGQKTAGGSAVFRVRPENISRLRGQHNHNIQKLRQGFQLKTIAVIADEKMAEDALRIDMEDVTY